MRETNKETPFTVQQNKNLIPGTLVNKTDVHHLEESKTEGKTRTTPEAQTRNMLNGHDLNKRSITKNT